MNGSGTGNSSQSAVLDALAASIALLDATGRIVLVNQSWKGFATQNNLQTAEFGVGANYLDVCSEVPHSQDDTPSLASEGIRRVLNGELPRFVLEYPCTLRSRSAGLS